MQLPKEIENFLELASQEDDGKIPQDLLPREEFNVGKVVREICMSSNLFDEEKKILCDSIGDYRHGGEPFSDMRYISCGNGKVVNKCEWLSCRL